MAARCLDNPHYTINIVSSLIYSLFSESELNYSVLFFNFFLRQWASEEKRIDLTENRIKTPILKKIMKPRKSKLINVLLFD